MDWTMTIDLTDAKGQAMARRLLAAYDAESKVPLDCGTLCRVTSWSAEPGKVIRFRLSRIGYAPNVH